MAAPSTRLRLRVAPGSRRAGVVGRHGEGWKLRVTAAPERDAANGAVLRLLAEALELPERSLTLVSGRGGRDKIVEIAGLGPAEIDRRLASAERKEPAR